MTFFAPDFQPSSCSAVVVLGKHVDPAAADNSTQVSIFVVLQVHIRNSHGFSRLVCSELEDLC